MSDPNDTAERPESRGPGGEPLAPQAVTQGRTGGQDMAHLKQDVRDAGSAEQQGVATGAPFTPGVARHVSDEPLEAGGMPEQKPGGRD